jgi:hypothetical protein
MPGDSASPTLLHRTLASSVKLRLSFSEVHWFGTLWNDTLRHSSNAFNAPKSVCILLKINVHAVYAF